MNLVEILLTVFLIAAVIAAIAAIIVRKRSGKGCSCGCEGCPHRSDCGKTQQ